MGGSAPKGKRPGSRQRGGSEGARPTKRRTASKGKRREPEGPREVQTTVSKWPAMHRDQKCAYIRNHDDNWFARAGSRRLRSQHHKFQGDRQSQASTCKLKNHNPAERATISCRFADWILISHRDEDGVCPVGKYPDST